MNKEQIIKEKTFEDFLAEKHAEDHCGNKKDMAEDFNYWLTNLQIDDVIKYADEHTKTQNQDLLEKIKGMKEKVEDADYYLGYNQALEDIKKLIK